MEDDMTVEDSGTFFCQADNDPADKLNPEDTVIYIM